MAYLTYNSKILARSGKWIDYSNVGPTLPPYTIRLKFTEGVTPTFSKGTAVQVSASPNVWDLTYENADWSYLCNGQSNLIEVIDANTSGVTNMHGLFSNCTSLTSVSLFNTSSVTDMYGMFSGCTAITTVPLFNTSNATSMGAMFYNCSSLTTVPLFNTSSVTSMSQMFQNCTNVQSGALALYQQASAETPPPTHNNTFTNCGYNTTTGHADLLQIPVEWGGLAVPAYTIRLKFSNGITPTFSKGTATQVSSSPNVWDLVYANTDWHDLCRDQPNLIEVISANTSGVTLMYNMFRNCPSLTTVAFFDTSSVTTMGDMFLGCSSLIDVPLFDTSTVTNMDGMFLDCSSLATVPLFDTSNVEYTTYMFSGCNALHSVPRFDTSSVTNTSCMFLNCWALETIPLLDTSNVTNMYHMCGSCRSLTAVPLFDTSSATDMEGMFYLSSNVRSGALALYQQASTQAVPPANHTDTFSYCGSNTVAGRAELAQIPADWGGTAT